MTSIDTLVGKAKKDKNGNWIWNGESYEDVLLIMPYLKNMSFASLADAQAFEKMEQEWKANNLKQQAQKSGDKTTVAQINRWQKNRSRIKHDDISNRQVYVYHEPTFSFGDSLKHYSKGQPVNRRDNKGHAINSKEKTYWMGNNSAGYSSYDSINKAQARGKVYDVNSKKFDKDLQDAIEFIDDQLKKMSNAKLGDTSYAEHFRTIKSEMQNGKYTPDKLIAFQLKYMNK